MLYEYILKFLKNISRNIYLFILVVYEKKDALKIFVVEEFHLLFGKFCKILHHLIHFYICNP